VCPDDHHRQVDVLVGVAEKFDDHAGNDDGEQRLPVEVVGKPENVEIDLLEDGHAPLCCGALAVYPSPRVIGNFHARREACIYYADEGLLIQGNKGPISGM